MSPKVLIGEWKENLNALLSFPPPPVPLIEGDKGGGGNPVPG